MRLNSKRYDDIQINIKISQKKKKKQNFRPRVIDSGDLGKTWGVARRVGKY